MPLFEAKLLYRRLDSLFGVMDPHRPKGDLLKVFVDESFRFLSEDLHITAILYYEEKSDRFALEKVAGDPRGAVAQHLDPVLLPLRLLFKHGVYMFSNVDAEESPFRQDILSRCASAGISVGRRGRRSILFFMLDPGWVPEELDFTLNTVRAALGARLMEQRVRGTFREAAEIQQSLLPDDPPAFPGYDIACRSISTEEVGGDFYDFLLLEDQLLGLSIGDASGHGLPAALLVRDIVTGLRMGIERHLKVAYVFEKLNGVINRSGMSSRFVSVFYGELEATGNLIYVNAGHQPPLVISNGNIEPLKVGGTVIGPLPEAKFRRGIARLERGAVLVLCTDGILERRDSRGDFLGEDGLLRIIEANRGRSAQEMLDRLFAATYDHGSGKPLFLNCRRSRSNAEIWTGCRGGRAARCRGPARLAACASAWFLQVDEPHPLPGARLCRTPLSAPPISGDRGRLPPALLAPPIPDDTHRRETVVRVLEKAKALAVATTHDDQGHGVCSYRRRLASQGRHCVLGETTSTMPGR